MIPLNLSTLSVEQASSFEQICEAAMLNLTARRDEAKNRFRKSHCLSDWHATAEIEMKRADELLGMTRKLRDAAHKQSLRPALPIRGDVGRAA